MLYSAGHLIYLHAIVDCLNKDNKPPLLATSVQHEPRAGAGGGLPGDLIGPCCQPRMYQRYYWRPTI